MVLLPSRLRVIPREHLSSGGRYCEVLETADASISRLLLSMFGTVEWATFEKKPFSICPKQLKGVKLSSESFERVSELCESCALGYMTVNVSRKLNVMPPYAFHTVAFDIIPFREQGEESSPPKKRDAEHNEWILHMVDPYSGYHQAAIRNPACNNCCKYNNI
jgi:hypothetical protein